MPVGEKISVHHISGNPFKCYQEVWYLQPMIPPKRFDIFPPDWGMVRRSRCVQIFLSTHICMVSNLRRLTHGIIYSIVIRVDTVFNL